MAKIYADRVKETTVAVGVGTIDLDGAVAGFQTFVSGIGDGNTCDYTITDDVNWEVGTGTVTDASPDTLSRTTIHSSSNSGAAINWGIGTKDVFCTLAATNVAPSRGYIDGLILSNAADGDHDIKIVPGVARDDSNTVFLERTSNLTKQIDAPWTVGAAAGGNDQAQLDGAQTITFTDNGGSDDFVTIDAGTWTVTPSIGDTLVVVGGTNAGSYQITASTTTQIDVATASFTADAASTSAIHTVKINTWYHVWFIHRSDTGVIDILFSESATSPTLPTNYDRTRRIGSVLTDSSANILAFSQFGDEFLWVNPIIDFSGTIGATAETKTLSVPTGLKVNAKLNLTCSKGSSDSARAYVSSFDVSDQVPSGSLVSVLEATSSDGSSAPITVRTNTSAQVRTRAAVAATSFGIATLGWIDTRGKNE